MSASPNYVPPSKRGSEELRIALENAVSLNSYSVHSRSNPSVHLEAALRFVPRDYQGSAPEIAQCFREGRVLSIDLGSMESDQAARLVDFCSGMTSVCSGWIFQVAESVIVLTPVIT